ncbi:hypothetical protein [Sinorhizobium americanum]|uniref:hypothetical protein n=1 Tax=Sinorhizobium americanum TaxID=194963 RepID=UPI001FD8B746|nr:hypothetical protein [Sinorhizobium americanum]
MSSRPLKFITLLHASRRPRSVLVRAFSQHLRYDELAQARGQELYEVLNTSQGARMEPLGIVISSLASASTLASICRA